MTKLKPAKLNSTIIAIDRFNQLIEFLQALNIPSLISPQVIDSHQLQSIIDTNQNTLQQIYNATNL